MDITLWVTHFFKLLITFSCLRLRIRGATTIRALCADDPRASFSRFDQIKAAMNTIMIWGRYGGTFKVTASGICAPNPCEPCWKDAARMRMLRRVLGRVPVGTSC
jgi:hypothetical protein